LAKPTATVKITKAQARAFRERWRLVNAREAEEVRSTSMEVKWQQFNTLLALGRRLGWTDPNDEGVAEVRERWSRLRKAHLESKLLCPSLRRSRRKRGKGQK
jgi:hypothetical protein